MTQKPLSRPQREQGPTWRVASNVNNAHLADADRSFTGERQFPRVETFHRRFDRVALRLDVEPASADEGDMEPSKP